MPRDISGNYTLPSGVNPVVNNTLIDVAWANPTLSDIATQLNNVLTRDGLLGPILPLKLVDGTVGAPALCFGSQPTTGFYKTASGFGFGISGANVISVDATAFQIPTSNLGLRQVLSAWGSGIGGAIQQVGGSLYSFNSSNISLAQNIYHDGTNGRCVNTGYSSSYLQNGGAHYFYTAAASTTAGSIPTLSTALTIDNSGKVGIGTTPVYPLDIRAAEPYVSVRKPAANSNFYGYNIMAATDILSSWLLNSSSGEVRFTAGYTGFGGYITLVTNGVDRMRIDSSGNVIHNVNTSAPSLSTNQQMVFALTSDTNLRVSVRGSDGTTRVANITLA